MKNRMINLLVFLCLILCGCSSSSDVSTKKESNNLEINIDDYSLSELSSIYCEEMIDGKFENIVNDFSSELAEQINEKQLKDAWKSFTNSIGKYKSVCEVVENSEMTYDVNLKFEYSGLKVSLSYNNKKEVNGIYLNYCDVDSISDNDSDSSDKGYYESKIKIGEYEVDGILTLPVSEVRCPVVVMVQGSGQSDYDEKVSNLKPFEDIAKGLAENGIASLRINKRFYQFPELYDNKSTIYDEVLDDIYEAIDYISNNESVDKDRIYLLGHSLGAMLGPKIFSEKNAICGFISMAGSPRKLEDIILDQNKEYLAQLDINEDERKKQLQEILDTVEKIKKIDPYSDTTLFGASSKYWSSLNDIDYISLVNSRKVPVLILQGAQDKQIFVEKDFSELKSLYGKNAEYILYDGLNHLFMEGNDLHVSENVINDISKWIKKDKQ